MERATVLKGLRAGCGALAFVIIGAAGCSESGGDRVGSGPAERPPSASPPASSPTAPSGSASAPSATSPGATQETPKPAPGAGSGGGSASPAAPATPPTSSDPGQAAKSDAGTEASSRAAGTETKTDAATTPRAAGAGGQGAERVTAIQQALKDEGHDPGEIDGLMGPRTRAALRAFQTAEGLPATGRSDAATLEALGVGQEGGG